MLTTPISKVRNYGHDYHYIVCNVINQRATKHGKKRVGLTVGREGSCCIGALKCVVELSCLQHGSVNGAMARAANEDEERLNNAEIWRVVQRTSTWEKLTDDGRPATLPVAANYAFAAACLAMVRGRPAQ